MAEEVKGSEVDLAALLEAERKARQEVEDKFAVTAVERDNYKIVALKRKGKLENDENFFGEHDEADIEKTVAEKAAQLQREREIARKVEEAEKARLLAEQKLEEVIRAQEQKPASVIGQASGGGQEVKDSVFSEQQIADFKKKWTIMGFGEEAQKRMLETEKRNALARRQP